MKRLLSALGSLKLTVVLVLALAVTLSAGTILESLRGAEAARAVYYAPWFFALQGVFGLNLLAGIIDRWPRNRWRIGFAITHVSMLLILIGAVMTANLKIEGRLPLWEGQSSNLVFRSGEQPPYELGFEVRLEDFQIDVYPGTRRPAMFRSKVVVVDPRTGEEPAVIEMNRPLSHGGFSFFQSSYQIREGREMTILSVARDPGEPVVFVGYVLLVVGMIVVFATRLIQHNNAVRNGAAALAACALLGLAAAPAEAALVPDASDVPRLAEQPVQHDGRAMPFDTQARDDVWTVTGRRAWPGIEPVAMAFGWTIDPDGWAKEPIVRLRSDVAQVAGTTNRWASFDELVGNRVLLEAFQAARQRAQAEDKPAPLDKHLLDLEQKLVTLDGYFSGQAIRPVPVADPVGAWKPIAGLRSAAQWLEAAPRIREGAPAHYPTKEQIGIELGYNRARPTRLAWWALVPSMLFAIAALYRDRRWLDLVAGVGVAAGFAIMTWGIAARWQVAGRIPASNMYESMLFLAWGVGLFGIVAVLLKNRLLVANAAGASAVAMLLCDLLPMDPFVHPMAPVLSGTPWLAIHVPIVVISYSVFALATVLGHMVIGAEIFAPAGRERIRRWNQLLYWYLHVGSILLIAGILTGSIWAASSWGRYWGWDPKEVWSLVAFLAYMAILHARFDHQIEDFGVAAGSIAAFWTILMTYLGVNFVLASGLHSYGFGSSNLVRSLASVAVVEIAFLTWGWLAVRRRLAPGTATRDSH